MAIHRTGYAAYCDAHGPDCEADNEDAFMAEGNFLQSLEEARVRLRKAGWKCGKRDICPACQENPPSEGE